MHINSRINKLERDIDNIKLNRKPMFFDSWQEYYAALENGEVGEHRMCFINDIPEVDNIEE